MTRQTQRRARSPRRGAATVAVGLAVLVMLAGCSVSPPQSSAEPTALVGPHVPLRELVVADDPRALTGPSTALIESSRLEPVAVDPAQSLPVTVTSRDLDGDREVVVDDASRILPLDIAGSIAAAAPSEPGSADTMVCSMPGPNALISFATRSSLPPAWKLECK